MKKVMLFVMAAFMLFAANAQELENSLLWKVSGNGLEKSSYLYGTYHVLCPDDLNISDKIKEAFEESDQLVLELDFDDPTQMQTIQQNMMYRDGTTAKDYLNEKEYELVSGFFTDSMNMPFERLKVIKPFFLSSMTLIHFLGCRPVSFEQKLTKMAEETEMTVQGLETAKEQLGLIENIPMEEQKKMLVESLEKQDSSAMMFDKLVNHYLNEELSALNKEMEKYMSDQYADFQKDMLTDRNKRWVESIEEMEGEKSSFIAIGAGHLPGKEGLIELLREEGYTVEAVK